MPPTEAVPLLEVEGLVVDFPGRDGVGHAVNGLTYTLRAGETLALVGESGSGKSVSAKAIMGTIEPPGYLAKGWIRFHGTELVGLDDRERRRINGEKIAMIYQDPLSALNPLFPVGWQIAEMFRVHRGLSRAKAAREAVKLMDRVGIPAPRHRARDYPHQFSGGQRQRVLIAMALALDPEVLIADEPTTALDVTVQAQIMELLASLREETGLALLLITHDLGVVADFADRVVVMYAGSLMETGSIFDIFRQPSHPYTKGLIESIPRLDREESDLIQIEGNPPDLMKIPHGCPFHPRCYLAKDHCREATPPPYVTHDGRLSACHYHETLVPNERGRPGWRASDSTSA